MQRILSIYFLVTTIFIACSQENKNLVYTPIEEIPEIEFEITPNISQYNKTFTNTTTNQSVTILNHLEQTGFHFYNAVSFKTEKLGIIAGGAGLRARMTKNGGANWKEFRFSKFANVFHDCGFSGESMFLVGESNFIFRSIDNGGNWSVFNIAPFFEEAYLAQFKFYKIKFIKEELGFIVGERNGVAVILKTIDAGANWTLLKNNGLVNEEFGIGDIHLISEKEIRIVALSGRCYKSDDQGENWTMLFDTGDTNKSLNAIEFIDKNTGFISGLNGNFLHTPDGGASWNPVALPRSFKKQNISDLLFFNNRIYFTTARSFSDETPQNLMYSIDKKGLDLKSFLTKNDSTVTFVNESYSMNKQGKNLYITTRNNVYKTALEY